MLADASAPPRLLLLQHSTPATFNQRSHDLPTSLDLALPGTSLAERRQRLHKSVSLDETVSPSKTKMASCIIKSVLSKKMQIEQTMHNSLGERQENIQENLFSPAEAHNNSSQNNRNSLYHGSLAIKFHVADKNCITQRALGPGVPHQHPSVSTRTQQKPPLKQNCVSVSASSLPGCRYQNTGRRWSEIANTAGKIEVEGEGDGEREGDGETEVEGEREKEGAERLRHQEAGKQCVNWNSGARLSCDSAKSASRSTCVGQGTRGAPEGRQEDGGGNRGGGKGGECQRGGQGNGKQQRQPLLTLLAERQGADQGGAAGN